MINLRGAFTALATPFNTDGSVDEGALRAFVDWQIAGGIDGLVPVGTTGESATLSPEEHLRVVQIVVDQANGAVPVIAGAGNNNTASSLAITKAVAELGVDAAMAVVPYYNKPSQEGLYRHFATLADLGTPLVVYNVPARTVISLTPETIARLAAHENVVAIKEASADMAFDTRMMALCGERIAFLSGDDFTTFPFLAIGGHGCISVVSNLAPGLMHDLVAAAANGDLRRGRALHQRACRIARHCFTASNPVPAKIMLTVMGVFPRADVRAPLCLPEEPVQVAIRASVQAEGLAR
jgi:4-hydroxy-tetrahydrodipicolinate synthase